MVQMTDVLLWQLSARELYHNIYELMSAKWLPWLYWQTLTLSIKASLISALSRWTFIISSEALCDVLA